MWHQAATRTRSGGGCAERRQREPLGVRAATADWPKGQKPRREGPGGAGGALWSCESTRSSPVHPSGLWIWLSGGISGLAIPDFESQVWNFNPRIPQPGIPQLGFQKSGIILRYPPPGNPESNIASRIPNLREAVVAVPGNFCAREVGAKD